MRERDQESSVKISSLVHVTVLVPFKSTSSGFHYLLSFYIYILLSSEEYCAPFCSFVAIASQTCKPVNLMPSFTESVLGQGYMR